MDICNLLRMAAHPLRYNCDAHLTLYVDFRLRSSVFLGDPKKPATRTADSGWWGTHAKSTPHKTGQDISCEAIIINPSQANRVSNHL
jgi:hypothetical protein